MLSLHRRHRIFLCLDAFALGLLALALVLGTPALTHAAVQIKQNAGQLAAAQSAPVSLAISCVPLDLDALPAGTVLTQEGDVTFTVQQGVAGKVVLYPTNNSNWPETDLDVENVGNMIVFPEAITLNGDGLANPVGDNASGGKLLVTFGAPRLITGLTFGDDEQGGRATVELLGAGGTLGTFTSPATGSGKAVTQAVNVDNVTGLVWTTDATTNFKFTSACSAVAVPTSIPAATPTNTPAVLMGGATAVIPPTNTPAAAATSTPLVLIGGATAVIPPTNTPLVPPTATPRLPADTSACTPPTLDWVGAINALRTGSGLPPVTENADMTLAACYHSRYMVNNDVKTRAEDTANPWYTKPGDIAGRSGDPFTSDSQGGNDKQVLNQWLGGANRLLALLDPNLTQVGFAISRDSSGDVKTAATLYLNRGASPNVSYPIYYPPNGGQEPFKQYNGDESPSALDNCQNYTAPSGPAIILLVNGSNVQPNVTASSLTDGVNAVAHCYILKSSPVSSVTIIPKTHLQQGSTYKVGLTVNGKPYSWSFQVGDKAAVAPTNIASPTKTPTVAPTNIASPTKTPTVASTSTSAPTKTSTIAPTNTPAPTKTPTVASTSTSAPTKTPTVAPTNTSVPTKTLTTAPTNTSVPTKTPTPAPTNTATSAPVNTPTEPSPPSFLNLDPADGLAYLNGVRQQMGLAPVTIDPTLSANADKHAHYIVLNDSYLSQTGEYHSEDPSKPGYTAEGEAVAGNSDIDPTCYFGWEAPMRNLLRAPLHAIGLLDPSLDRIGTGHDAGGALKPPCAFVVGFHFQWPPVGPYPIYYPPPNGVHQFVAWDQAEGDALFQFAKNCTGKEAGAAIFLKDAANIQLSDVTSASFAQGDTATNGDSCVGVYFDWIYLIPPSTLTSGSKYTVSITSHGKPYTWSFTAP